MQDGWMDGWATAGQMNKANYKDSFVTHKKEKRKKEKKKGTSFSLTFPNCPLPIQSAQGGSQGEDVS